MVWCDLEWIWARLKRMDLEFIPSVLREKVQSKKTNTKIRENKESCNPFANLNPLTKGELETAYVEFP